MPEVSRNLGDSNESKKNTDAEEITSCLFKPLLFRGPSMGVLNVLRWCFVFVSVLIGIVSSARSV